MEVGISGYSLSEGMDVYMRNDRIVFSHSTRSVLTVLTTHCQNPLDMHVVSERKALRIGCF